MPKLSDPDLIKMQKFLDTLEAWVVAEPKKVGEAYKHMFMAGKPSNGSHIEGIMRDCRKCVSHHLDLLKYFSKRKWSNTEINDVMVFLFAIPIFSIKLKQHIIDTDPEKERDVDQKVLYALDVLLRKLFKKK